MKKLIITLIFILSASLFGQTESSVKPNMFSSHGGETMFATNIQSEGDSVYTYQFVKVDNRTESALLEGLLNDYDDTIPYSEYYARSQERVRYAVKGYIDVSNAEACGYSAGITEAEMKEKLGVTNYAPSNN